MSETVADKDGVSRIVMMIRGVMDTRGFYWCYVAVKPSLAKKFQQAIKAKYNIQNFVKDGYGEIIVSGRGRTPPQEVTEKVAEMAGIDPKQLQESDTEIDLDKIIAAVPAQPQPQNTSN